MKSNTAYLVIMLGLLWCSPTFAKQPHHPYYQRITNKGHEIHLLSFHPKAVDIVDVKSADNSRQTVRDLVKVHKAYAGINGGFFAVDTNQMASPVGALKINGEWVKRATKQTAVMGWNTSDQKPHFGMINTKLTQESVFEKADFVVAGIPLLIKNNKPIDYKREKKIDSFRDERHARTAVCVKKDGTWLWLVVSHTKKPDREHLNKILEGFTLKELTDFLLKQGCVDAINLDGGGSSTLVIDNKIVNQPAGDFTVLMGYIERPIYDAMLLKLKTNEVHVPLTRPILPSGTERGD